MKYALIFLFGCLTPNHPWPVKIVSPVPQQSLTKVTCYISEIPEAPKPLSIDFENQNIIDRAFVHIRDYDAQVTWSRDMATWANLVDLCLRRVVIYNSGIIEIKRVP